MNGDRDSTFPKTLVKFYYETSISAIYVFEMFNVPAIGDEIIMGPHTYTILKRKWDIPAGRDEREVVAFIVTAK